MVLNIILIILFVFILITGIVILIPLKLELSYKTEEESKKDNLKKQLDKKLRDNYLKIYILGFIALPKIKLKVKKNSKLLENRGVLKNILNTVFSISMEFIGMEKVSSALLNKKELTKINQNIYFKKLDLKFGFNFYNVIINAYFISIINSLLALLFAYKEKTFNLNDLSYFTYISNKQIYNLDIFCILKFNLANTIGILIKVFIKFRKVAKEYGETNTSNRRFNDDSYDVA